VKWSSTVCLWLNIPENSIDFRTYVKFPVYVTYSQFIFFSVRGWTCLFHLFRPYWQRIWKNKRLKKTASRTALLIAEQVSLRGSESVTCTWEASGLSLGVNKVNISWLFVRHDGIWGTGDRASCSGRITPSEKFPGVYWIGGWFQPRFYLGLLKKRKTSNPSQEPNQHSSVVLIYHIIDILGYYM